MILIKDNNGKIHQTTDGTNAIIPSLNVTQEVLWTNPNPNQSFQPQSVNLSDNYTNYDILIFTFKTSAGNDGETHQYTLYTKNANNGTILVVDSNNNEYSTPNWYGRRHFTLNGNVCTFTQGAANTTISNDIAKPIQIIGLKFLDTLNYSTEEQYTGKHWIDGKKIYQKTIEYTSGWRVGGDATLTYSIPNIDNITSFNSIMYRNNGMVITDQQVVNIADSNWSLQIYNVKTNELGIHIGSHYTNTDAINKILLIFEYTKTTE